MIIFINQIDLNRYEYTTVNADILRMSDSHIDSNDKNYNYIPTQFARRFFLNNM